MNIKELIEKYEYLNHSYFRRVDTSEVLKDLRQLDKPQKVKVPQFVADWYEEHKDNLEYNIWDWMKYNLEPKKRENVIFSQWLGKTVNNPVETLIKMKLFGYEVEKEKLELVAFPNIAIRKDKLKHIFSVVKNHDNTTIIYLRIYKIFGAYEEVKIKVNLSYEETMKILNLEVEG
jgi:gp178|nr:MAG TPA: Protein of unknown function (DUF1642) [Caudoviricetes sp.]